MITIAILLFQYELLSSDAILGSSKDFSQGSSEPAKAEENRIPFVVLPAEDPAQVLAEVMALRIPVLFSPANTGVDQWKALKWSRESLLKVAQSTGFLLNNVKNGSYGEFMLRNTNRPISDLPQTAALAIHEKMRDYHLEPSMPMVDFLKHSDNHSSQFLYYSGKLSAMPDSIRRDAAPLDFLRLEPVMSEAMIWMAHEGVTANTHYDRSHNLFVHLVGEKTWYLYPPTSWFHFYLYPSLHQHYHQSQVVFDQPDLSAFPHFPRAKPFQITLQPGDILYVPPFWIHRVQAHTFCASISVVTPSEEEAIYNNAFWMPVRLSRSWKPAIQVYAAKLYVTEIVRKVYQSDDDVPEAIELLLIQNRWRAFPLHPSDFDDCSSSLIKFLSKNV